MKLLAINPGSTSTKIAVYEDVKPLISQTLRHSSEELAPYPRIIDQYDFRKNIILQFLASQNIPVNSLDVIVGRGGLVKPIPGGVYRVNDIMIDDLKKEIMGEHASNIGGILAYEIAKEIGHGTPSFIVDPVVVDEMEPLARYSGLPELPRVSIFHALNQKAVARRHSREVEQKYEELSLIVVHLGGGVSVGVHKNGKVIDVNNALDGEGPYSPERSGTLPVGALAKMCFSGRYQLADIRKKITGKGGLVAYLNTNTATDIEERISTGDNIAKEIYEGMAYQIAKEVGSCATVLFGKVDAILITGGLAYSDMVVGWLKERCEFLAPVYVYPGEDEMCSLAESVYYALMGEQEIKEYV